MRVVIAVDAFKGSLASMEAGYAIERGVQRVFHDAEIIVRPLADGGEGTVEALVAGMGGVEETVMVTGPLLEKVWCKYGILRERDTAIVEMAGAAGLPLVPVEKRNPLKTTTYGVGEVIRDAISKGCRNFIVGIGGSATNDGGAGMLMALGYDFLDEFGHSIPLGAEGLKRLKKISDENVLPELKDCSFKVACDVNNPLCGENGASTVFGPQKGADLQMVADMDSWLENFAAIAKAKYEKADSTFPGTGAAGGLGFAFLGFTNGTLESGIKIILEETELESYVNGADIVITGEGRLDAQTSMGKAPIGVAKLGKKYGSTVLAFAGSIGKGAADCNENGMDAFFSIVREITTLEKAMNPRVGAENLADTVEQVFRLMKRLMEIKE